MTTRTLVSAALLLCAACTNDLTAPVIRIPADSARVSTEPAPPFARLP